jgi:hypothetical protein
MTGVTGAVVVVADESLRNGVVATTLEGRTTPSGLIPSAGSSLLTRLVGRSSMSSFSAAMMFGAASSPSAS